MSKVLTPGAVSPMLARSVVGGGPSRRSSPVRRPPPATAPPALPAHRLSFMQPLTRQFVTSLIVLVVFVAAALTGQAWLQRETRRLRAATVTARRAQFLQALEITGRPPGTWDEAFERGLGRLLGGTVTLVRPGAAGGMPAAASPVPSAEASPATARPATPGTDSWSFDYPVPDGAGLSVHVVFAPPATARLAAVHERLLVAISLLAVFLFLVSLVFALPRRGAGGNSAPEDWPSARTEMHGLEHFARMSVERGEALHREAGARLRAEEDLQLQRTLLGQSRDEREQLGRELHDNLCQTLYAVSLTLESLRPKLGAASEAGPRLDQCVAELRRLNREVRSYLRDLEPGAGQNEPFAQALDAMLTSQTAVSGIRVIRNLDPEVTALIAPEQTTDVVNILREAISNSLRHGRPRTITVRAGLGEGSVVLAVQDDGAGFDPATRRGPGHGLVNMQARADALGGSVAVVSTPGKGTRVLLTLPVASV